MSIPLHILLIADSETDIQIVLQELQNGGYLPSYQRADSRILMQLALQQQRWDLVICDHSLLAFNALDALKTLQTTCLDLPLIVLSETQGEDLAVEIMRAGATDYLLKRQIKQLVPAVERALKQAKTRCARQLELAATSQLAAIVESSEDAIISTDAQGAVLTWNLGAERLYGYSATEALGQPLAHLIQPDLAQTPLSQLQGGLASDMQIMDCRQVTHRRRTGELIDVSLTLSLVRDAAGAIAGFAIIARDISEGQRVQRLKDQFISVVNHELRTPLASLQGSVELLLTGKLGTLSAQGLRMLEIAANNLDRLVKLTDNILDLEGLSTGAITMQTRPCVVEQLLSQAVERSQTVACRRGVRLLVAPMEQAVEILLDPDRIVQVLTHLILNAVQSSQVDSSVWLMAEVVEAQARVPKRLPSLRKEQGSGCLLPQLLIRIKDQGQGIPADKLETIFGQFQQVDASDTRRQGGAGLGLAICRSIVQQHQGQLWVESTLGQGSTFYLALPLQRIAVRA